MDGREPTTKPIMSGAREIKAEKKENANRMGSMRVAKA